MGKSISKEQRASVLRNLEESGLSVAEFCRQHGMSYWTVTRWRRAARRRAVQSENGKRFVELELLGEAKPEVCGENARESASGSPTVLCAELSLPGGAVLRVYGSSEKGGVA